MPKKKSNTDPTSRFEAYMVSRFLQDRKIKVDWVDVYRLTPKQIAEKYGVEESDILIAIRRS